MRSRVYAVQSCIPRHLLRVVGTSLLLAGPCALARADAASAPRPRTTLALVGIVAPRDLRANDTFRAVVLTDLKSYAAVPGLRVIELVAPIEQEKDGSLSLAGSTVRCAGGAVRAASESVLCRAPVDGEAVELELSRADASPPVRAEIPVTRGASGRSRGEAFETPPVCVPGAVQVVSGPLDPAGAGTAIDVDGVAAAIIAQSPREAFWSLPPETGTGAHVLRVRSGRHDARMRITVLRLGLFADRARLERGEETPFRAVLSGLDGVPESAWRARIPAGLVDSERLARVAPGFRAPARGEPGVILLAIENASRDTITLEGARDGVLVITVDRASVRDGVFRYDGVIRSKQEGPFAVNATVIPLLTPPPAEEAPRSHTPGGPAADSPGQ